MKRKRVRKPFRQAPGKADWPLPGYVPLDPASLNTTQFRGDTFAAAARAIPFDDPGRGGRMPLGVAILGAGGRAVAMQVLVEADSATRLIRSVLVRTPSEVHGHPVRTPFSASARKAGPR